MGGGWYGAYGSKQNYIVQSSFVFRIPPVEEFERKNILYIKRDVKLSGIEFLNIRNKM